MTITLDIVYLFQVSEGAELIMLSKTVFTRHATEQCKKYVRENVRIFPSEDMLQESLQDKVNWDLYKKELVSDYVTQIKLLQAAKSNRK